MVEDQTRGYPRLTALMNRDDFFKTYRRSDFLRGRILLDREIGLGRLEERLLKMDEDNAKASEASIITRNIEYCRDALVLKEVQTW